MEYIHVRKGFSILALLIVLGMVALGAGIGVRYVIESSRVTTESPVSNPSLSRATTTDAVAPNPEFVACKNAADFTDSIACYSALNLRLKDPALCPQLGGEFDMRVQAMGAESFVDSCYTLRAGELNDISVCDNIVSPKTKDSCYTEVAVSLKDKTLCEKIHDPYFVGKCTDIISLATTGVGPTQAAQARNVQRWSNVSAILNAVGQREANNRGVFETGCIAGPVPAVSKKISSIHGYDVAPCLLVVYLSNMPFDPHAEGAHYASNTDYDTGYFIQKDSVTGRVTVSAPSAELGEVISITR